MDFYHKLPRNFKEFLLFMGVISLISVNLIAPLITCFEVGFTGKAYLHALHVIPWIWLCVILLVLTTYRPAEWITGKIVREGDSFGACITVNILSAVLLMSIVLTIVGSWIGSGSISMEAFRLFFYRWPRNFAISFGVESLIAQPIARLIMVWIHREKEKVIE